MASYQPTQELKNCLAQLFDSDVKVDKVLWELLPTYFKIKIPELKVVSIGLKTNEEGNEIIVSICIVNTLSAEKLSTILAVLDLINLSTSKNWLPYSYSFNNIVDIEQDHKLYKYCFASKNLSEKDLASKKTFYFNIY